MKLNFARIQKLGSLNEGASDAQIELLQKVIGSLPSDLKLILKHTNGFYLDNGIKLYSTEEIVERNKTFEVATYAPGFLAIGDDSGGLAILISLKEENPIVYTVDQGVLDPEYMTQVGDSLIAWIESGCPLEPSMEQKT